MDEALKQDIKDAIKSSGFPLEHYVDGILRKHDWQTITNRHYIDDVKGVEREIDIIAYKVEKDDVEKIEYITSLIISCKKSSASKWCFLTRDANHNDVNTDWTPYHYCTNDKVLSYMTKNHREIIIDRYLDHRAIKHLYNFDKRVFAYQVLTENITKVKEKNRTKEERHWVIAKNEALHDSIITPIKALDMEKRSRIEHHNNRPYNRYYTFHILSIFDGDMIQSHLDKDGEIDSTDITHINYLNRHIVNKIDDFYIVNFIKKDIFDYRLRLFDYLHQENARTLPKLVNAFYKDIFKHRDRVGMFWEEFSQELAETIQTYADSRTNPLYITDPLPILLYTYKDNKLIFLVKGELYEDNELFEELNKNKNFIKDVREILYRYYRYEGQVIFTNY